MRFETTQAVRETIKVTRRKMAELKRQHQTALAALEVQVAAIVDADRVDIEWEHAHTEGELSQVLYALEQQQDEQRYLEA